MGDLGKRAGVLKIYEDIIADVLGGLLRNHDSCAGKVMRFIGLSFSPF